MDNSRVLLFVVPGASSRSVAAMCEAAYHIGRQASSVVLCLQRMTEEQGSGEERLSKAALKDYNRGRVVIKSPRENLTTSSHFQELSSLTIGY